MQLENRLQRSSSLISICRHPPAKIDNWCIQCTFSNFRSSTLQLKLSLLDIHFNSSGKVQCTFFNFYSSTLSLKLSLPDIHFHFDSLAKKLCNQYIFFYFHLSTLQLKLSFLDLFTFTVQLRLTQTSTSGCSLSHISKDWYYCCNPMNFLHLFNFLTLNRQ